MDYRSESINQRFRVDFGYRVHFTEDVFAPGNALLEEVLRPPWPGEPAKVLFVLDAGLAAARPELAGRMRDYVESRAALRAPLPEPLLVPGGEEVKNRGRHTARILAAIDRAGLDRHAYVVVAGGGAVLDAAGLAAATAHRGIRLVRLPSTVLAQNDAGVGVKTGINAFGKKNFLGTFSPPHVVINDFGFLRTLDAAGWRAGISEAVKVALLKDPVFFDFLEDAAERLRERDEDAMRYLVRRCAELHLSHISTCGDPFETGSSRPLDFGHWSAHKLEALTGYRLAHGDAVAIGLALDVTYCRLAGWLSEPVRARILGVLKRSGFSLFVSELVRGPADASDPNSLLHGLEEFREHLGGRLTLMMLAGIGEGREVNEIDRDLMRRSVRILEQDASQAADHA